MVLGFLFTFDVTWFVTVVIAVVTYLGVSHWLTKRGLPPGPTSLPIIGNLLSLRRKDIRPDHVLEQWRKQYGDVYTIWIGQRPVIIAGGADTIREGLVTQRNAFSGRTQTLSTKWFRCGHENVVASDFGPTWEALRRLAHSAVRKFSDSEKLPVLVEDVVDQCLKSMWKETGPVDMNFYIYLAIYNILATTAFGERYDIKDQEFLKLKEVNDKLGEDFAAGIPGDIFPSLRYLFYHKELRLRRRLQFFFDTIKGKYEKHKREYTSGVVRDFTDAVLLAKEEAEKEDKDTAVHFTDGNLIMVLFDLFSAGTDTTRTSMNWILLYLANFPEVQQKIRQEIQDNIGDRMAVQEDKRSCPYTAAVLTEIQRIRSILSLTLEHKATCDVEYRGYRIPKGTGIMFHLYSSHNEESLWPDPQIFRPERFLDADGKFTGDRSHGYMPFSLGRRSCPGERLAKADIFLMVVRFLQKCRFSLPNGPGTADLEPLNVFFITLPKDIKLNIEKV